jgi:NADP-dependent 3-hydroxy acid dehydrogenase YdfG
MAGSLEGRKAVVTGASSGIGEATVEALAREGAEVAAGARRRDRLEELADRVGKDDGTVHAHAVDLTDEAAARSFIASSAEEMGGIDILVNNAGVMLLGPVAGADTEHWQRMINVNLLGLLYCTHAVLPIMGEAGTGHIVNVASTAGRQASLGAAVYNMTKFGVVAFSEALRQEVLHANVRVTCVEPGFVDTELQGHNEHPMVVEATEKVREEIGEVLQAGDIADAIVYALAQPDRVAVNEVLIRPTKQRR